MISIFKGWLAAKVSHPNEIYERKEGKIMKKRRSKIVKPIISSLIFWLFVSFTVAAPIIQLKKLNIIQIGNSTTNGSKLPIVKINLSEPGFLADPGTSVTVVNPGTSAEYTKVELYDVIPGQKINKDPTVTNVGLEPIYVRVQLLDPATGTVIDLNTGSAKLFGASMDRTKWLRKGDFWYYSVDGKSASPLSVGDSIPLLTINYDLLSGKSYTMMIPKEKTNREIELLKGALHMTIVAQAIQARAFTPDMNSPEPWHMADGKSPVTIIPAIYP